MYACMYVHMYVRMYVCMYVRTYVCMYVRTYVCMHACMYVCMYVAYLCMYLGDLGTSIQRHHIQERENPEGMRIECNFQGIHAYTITTQ